MEPFNREGLSDRELDRLLREWEAPEPPTRLRSAVFGDLRAPLWRPLWRRILGRSIRVPLPAAALAAIALALALWKWPRPVVYRELPPRVEVQTVRVEVPVMKKEVITRIVYRDRSARETAESSELRPVAELKPRIIRNRNASE